MLSGETSDREMATPVIRFGDRRLGAGQPVVIIAEIGINHEGRLDLCADMIRTAAGAGADAIKLQTVDADASYAPDSPSYPIFKSASLSPEQTNEMFEYARMLGMEAFTTCGDMKTLEWVNRLGPAAHKISSGLLAHVPYLRTAARTGRTLLMSTGMSTIDDIDTAVDAAHQSGALGRIALFQCTSLYPAPSETLNLATIGWLRDRYKVPTGFSDHSEGIDAAPLAVAAGASMIEKHLSFDPARHGFDHGVSLDPSDFGNMVDAIRRCESMMGEPEKRLSEEEIARARTFMRVVVARRSILSGQKISADDLDVMRARPGSDGIRPRDLEKIVGRHAARELARFDPISETDLA
jgi:N,N'-diacetyllegionaminate synthase